MNGKARKSFRGNSIPGNSLSPRPLTPENINDGIGCLQALIGQHVAAIAIKDIYFRELPPEIIDLANRNHTPILLFSNVNFEDIIFNIKNALLSNNFNASLIDRINELFRGPKNAGLDARIKNINPFFRANNICCYCRPASGEEQILFRQTRSILQSLSAQSEGIAPFGV